jgi:hypothetical protein
MDADPPGERGRQHGSGKQPTDAPGPVHRGKWARHVETGDRVSGGRPVRGEGSGLNDAKWHRSARESDRVMVPLKPGNAGGGKDPDFWCVFEANEVR